MRKPDEARTVVNVKGIDPQAWEAAKAAATKADETLGEWLNRVIPHHVSLEARNQVIPPANPSPKTANPDALPIEQLIEGMNALANLAQATGIAPSKALIRRAYLLFDEHTRQARGLAPRASRALPRSTIDQPVLAVEQPQGDRM